MVHGFTKTVDLKINVVSDEIYFFGQPEESAGKVLQGTVLLTLTETIKVKRLTLDFKGKMKVQWTEGPQHTHKQERSIIQHEWILLPSQNNKRPHIVPAGQHSWDFTLTLPGDLPPTLQAEMGKVCYQLTANLERSGGFLLHNTIQRKKPIRVVRSVLPSEFELVQSLEIHNTWSEKMIYDISLPSKLYAHNAIIPVSFTILPIANKLRVHAIMVTLKECCTYEANDKRKTDSRIIKINRQENPFSQAVVNHDGMPSTPWTRVLDVQVPARSPMIFCDANSDMIRIRHKLKFVISIVNADGHFSELRATLPIVIMDSFGPTISAASAEALTLPTYDESWRSLPYDRHLWDTLRQQNGSTHTDLMDSRQPVTISSFTRTMTLTSSMVPCHRLENTTMDSDLEDETVTPHNEANDENWWHGVDLSRVPSYHSMMDMDPTVPTCTQLPPAYDPIWQRCFSSS
ncbi:uncharacterized protein BX664DRAFT_339808 [Halteromyces radiatus]|uniref:uncharacterized protein n=1 Tax=Halteromyces radiatus TaxID=101107 RepID=UPI00221F2A5F|nr:uncharacterized protein BX664DRAFT_339808 [Halteromyces radiatus]KAI8083096.1 hypothetical protein BX664DRAFT_339808 [Halteromyces radiatus]